jgi:hypothetical protein
MPDSEKKLRRAVIKEELLALTGEWLKAVILQQFLYWGERVKDFDAFILEERLRKTESDLELTHGWIWKSAKDLKEEIMVDPLSEDTVRRRMAELVKAGWLEERNNPYHKWDRTLQYRPSIRRIQKDLQSLGYALEHYPLLIENSPIPQGAESNTQSEESSTPDAESNLAGAGAIPETPLETTPETPLEIDTPSLREQAKNGEMTTETELNLLCGYGRQGKAGIADPSQDGAQWFKYRDEAIQAVMEITGEFPNSSQQVAISELSAESAFSIELWEKSIHSCQLSKVKPGNVSCYIDTYRSGGDYVKMCRQHSNGAQNARSTHELTDHQKRVAAAIRATARDSGG